MSVGVKASAVFLYANINQCLRGVGLMAMAIIRNKNNKPGMAEPMANIKNPTGKNKAIPSTILLVRQLAGNRPLQQTNITAINSAPSTAPKISSFATMLT